VVAPEASIVYRYAIATSLLFGWCIWRGLNLKFGLVNHIRFMMMGLFLFSINYILTYSAQQYIPSALNAVVFSAMMWINVFNTRVFFGTRIEPKVYMGAALGLMGLIVLFWPNVSNISLTDQTLVGAGLSLTGALLGSFGNMVSHRSQMDGIPVVQSNTWGMFYGTIFTVLIALRRDVSFNFDLSLEYISSLLYLAIFGSIVAFGCYLKLLGRIGPHKAGYAMVMFPVVAVVLSILFEGLKIEMHILLGIGLVLAGNLFILGIRRIVLSLRQFMGKTWSAEQLAGLLFERKTLKETPCRDC
jgi:drug/metabolite transporter (DMT)-like permease